MAGSSMLYACTKCHSRHKFDDLSKEEQLCKECRKKYPLVSCGNCQLEFYMLKKVEGAPVCGRCAHSLRTYGEPKKCRYCTVKAAFKDKYCSRCISSEKKYGPPVKCDECSLMCAFKRPQESQAKVNGRVLCIKCTFKFKKERHKQQKQHRQEHNSAFGKSEVAPLRAENIHRSLYKSRVESEPSSRLLKRPGSPAVAEKHDNNNTTIETTFGDHMSELTSLREQIIKLNKTVAQKEKIILEKDKKINEFQAEHWEKDKLFRSKVQSVQKEYSDRVEQLQLDNQSLRKQLKDLTKTKKTPRQEKVSSRIRLEAHKISLTPTSNRSPAQTPSKSPDHVVVESEGTTGNEGDGQKVDFQKEETNATTEEADKVYGDAEEDSKVGSDGEDEKRIGDGEHNIEGRRTKHPGRRKRFDEAQAGEIKRILQEDNAEVSSGNDSQLSEKRSKKKRRNKHKSRAIIQDGDTSSDNEQTTRPTNRKKRKTDVSDDEVQQDGADGRKDADEKEQITDDDDDDDDGDVPQRQQQQQNDVSDNERSSGEMEIDEPKSTEQSSESD